MATITISLLPTAGDQDSVVHQHCSKDESFGKCLMCACDIAYLSVYVLELFGGCPSYVDDHYHFHSAPTGDQAVKLVAVELGL